jgi:hypothetical protein
MRKQLPEEITVRAAMVRLNLSKEGVIWDITHGHLTARKADAPIHYWLITIDDKFLAIEKRRNQAKA